ncbi:fatty acid synthase [Mumia flava]|uniref:Fatty acid synthase n=1 Tax=Mumia flava TaxID=1348852 RepID=A0A2M9BJS9_9ACTN|nr:type I polyketide synthase [Mumia flava]PJJ58205.1 fatty acid synthase [Mumia flava]
MTIIDAPSTAPAQHTDHRSRLLDDLNDGTPYAVAFGGQGAPWLQPLADLLRTHALGPQVHAVVTEADRILAPVSGDLARVPLPFTPLEWADAIAVAESAADDDAPDLPDADTLSAPAVSVPGILLAQLAGLHAVRNLGLTAAPTTVAAHSQGALAAAVVAGADEAEVLAVARLTGIAVQVVSRRRGLTGDTMLAVRGVSAEGLDEALEGLDPALRVHVGLRNGRRTTVLTGPADDLRAVQRHLEQHGAEQKRLRERKLTGGTPFAPTLEILEPRAAFHHPDLTAAADLVADWAQRCGLDAAWARELAMAAVVDPVDWVRDLDEVFSSGAQWILDLGPGDLASLLSRYEADAHGVGLLTPVARDGHRALTAVGAAPRRSAPWSAYAPSAVTLPDGRTVLETRFTRLTGRSPVILAGMTPTTVDPKIVAAAANAGFWAELAGGGQVSEPIFTENVDELGRLLEPGRTYAFNSLFLDPYLWKMQLGQQRLVQRARAAGAAIDAVIVTAGIPELEEAVALVAELREEGISHVVFKPGTVAQIRQVAAIAREVAPVPIIVQIEGGKAGGHHSWEDLDELLLTTYASLRALDNVVVCVGGGIGTPQIASEYLTGTWARRHGYPVMPLDGVLVGTAAMATLEATTSPEVKQMLLETPGTPEWIGAGKAVAGMASGRSQLGADIHEIDNTASRVGRLLDEVAGDADAVAERADEIVAALEKTAKPYFGDVTAMTYAAWLTRYVGLATVGGDDASDGASRWLDVTLRDRFHAMAQQAEARLAEADHGPVTTLFADADAVEDPDAALGALLRAYPAASEVVLHPADVPFFVEVCKRPGKPVPFVPVLDADVRRWYRSDSLWQAHDDRFGADAVCIIPGPVSVAGIDRVDEPVAELLRRFEDEAVDDVLTAGAAPARVGARRRLDAVEDALGIVLSAPDVTWAGRTVRNPVHRLGNDWVLVERTRAEHAETGASLVVESGAVVLEVPLGPGREPLTLRIDPAGATDGAVPVVATDDAAAAMTVLASQAAGGTLPEVSDGTATATVAWSPDLASDHAAVTGEPESDGLVPDVLVGLAWPSVFAGLASARTAGPVGGAGTTGTDGADVPVVEGLLDLVHLDHAVRLADAAPSLLEQERDLDVTASLEEVTDTEVGRVVAVSVAIATDGDLVATMTERFAIRGRTGAATLADPAVAGGAFGDDVRDTARRTRAEATLVAPSDLRAFAAVTGDHNPIHTSVAAARLAGLGDPIVHGMWMSAAAQRLLAPRRITGWTTRFLAPVAPGSTVDLRAVRIGMENGSELIEVTARSAGELVLAATARVAPPRTAYAFPGQGIQHQGMGMAGYQRSKAAREIWDRADAHTRSALGFSILTVVRENPTEIVAAGVSHKHPDGVLFLTQFTQVAMAVLGSAQVAELREAGAFVDDAVLAGHSVGEYNALSAVSGVIGLEAVIEVVFQRGSVMHTLVPRDADGRSDYRLAAIRPSQIGLDDADVADFLAQIAEESGEFLQIANENLRGSQYAIAGSVRGLELLEAEINGRRAEFGGKAAFILVPGIDVPFHSAVLRGGVPDFRHRLDELLPEQIDPEILIGRYVPNLVPKPFSLDRAFVAEIADEVPSEPLNEVLEDFERWAAQPGRLARRLLIELLAWQFASPVRWIETQDLMFGDLGVERFVEIGVGGAPTVANLASSTLKLPTAPLRPIEVLNVERDGAAVFATDTDPEPADDEPEAPSAPSSAEPVETASAPAPAAPTAPAGAERPADLSFDAADATGVLLAWWTKMRPDQIGPADSIESLCDGASSRRNQLLVDLGGELSLGAIDGAADADVPTLSAQVKGLARGYKPFGPVLSDALGDHLKKVLGPTGKRQSAIADRVRDTWQLGSGWASHTTAELAMATREGSSVRGGAYGDLDAPKSASDLDAAIDACVQAVGARNGVAVAMPSAGGGGDVTVDAAALGELTASITGPDGVLASTARHLLAQLDLDETAPAAEADDADAEVLALVESELGSDWARTVAPAFDARRALLLDDRWASAREDVTRIALGITGLGEAGADDSTLAFTGTGDVVARQARWWAGRVDDEALTQRLSAIADDALDTSAGAWSDEVAVVTGASPGSIAASVVGRLLAGGATVVASTSRLDGAKRRFFTDLYRSHARGGATLWVVPANLASFADTDALIAWVTEEQTESAAGVTTVTKPALTPTLLFPFAAGRVAGDLTEAGARSEIDMRILLWSVERLIAGFGAAHRDHDLDASLHVVLPGSPNRGTFGGDGGYGEAKAALDAVVAKWSSETWSTRVTLTHAIIGWVRGTGLMGGNDPLVQAVEEAGVRTWAPEEMADALLATATTQARTAGRGGPATVDLTGGLSEAALDLRALAEGVEAPAASDSDEGVTIDALAPSPAQLPATADVSWPEIETRPEDLVVIVGAGELGPYGSARTRFEIEVHDELSAAGVLELAWSTGLIAWENGGWYDVESQEPVAESEIHERYHDRVVEAAGIRRYADDGALQSGSAPLLASVYLDSDLTFTVGSEAQARALHAAEPASTVIAPAGDGDEWTVTRKAGTEIRVPRRLDLTRTVGGQIPTGFDPAAWGVPAEMLESLDRVAVWNLVCTVDAFLSSGFTPAELMRWVHPAQVASTQGTGMGGMTSMRSLYVDTLLGEAKQNDILQEALPNVIAAHVMQSYVGGYGAMVHPVAACATSAISVEEGTDKIRLGKADFVVAGGFDDLSTEGIVGFADMSATADTSVMLAKGIDERYVSRANDRRRGGFVESQGGGTLLLARGDVAARMGLPVLGVVAYAGSFADGVHTSIPAPGIGALAAARGGDRSMLARGLADVGLTIDDVAVVSKHDTSTNANDPNESELHERIGAALGRTEGNPLFVVSQKTLTGHAKGGAAAFQMIGLCQVMESGVVPPNRSLDCVDDVLAEHEHLVWLRKPLQLGTVRAGLVTSLGFGHVSALVAIAHPAAFLASLGAEERATYERASRARRISGRMRLTQAIYGGPAAYQRPAGRRLGSEGVREREASVLLAPEAHLAADGSYVVGVGAATDGVGASAAGSGDVAVGGRRQGDPEAAR